MLYIGKYIRELNECKSWPHRVVSLRLVGSVFTRYRVRATFVYLVDVTQISRPELMTTWQANGYVTL